jgi:hypothetical protein
MTNLTVEQMQLSGNARVAAQMLKKKLGPLVRFTSGRRTIHDQARVMADNTIQHGSAWLASTYKDRRMVSLLMTHVEENPEQLRSHMILTENFYNILNEHFGVQFRKMPHVVGRAFDIAWPRDREWKIIAEDGERICDEILALPAELGLELLLKKEGKLDVIHAQFASPSQEVVV